MPSICTRGMPEAKCNSILGALSQALSQQASGEQPSSSSSDSSGATPPPFNGVPCGTGFFSAEQQAALTAQFGLYTCERDTTSDYWFVIGSGTAQPETATTVVNGVSLFSVAPGGSMVAVEECAATDAACVDPTTQHNFADFTVYYPPNPSTDPLQLSAMLGPNLAALNDATCGEFLFDITSGTWYKDSVTNATDLTDGAAVSAVATPSSADGATALAASSPTPVLSGCSWN